jgi:hypothetical protein
MTIPSWTTAGVLPPFDARNPTSGDRSPYAASLTEVVSRFGDTPERRVLLDGLLRYRAGLHRAGLLVGFQWLDGSFAEQIELLEGRPPNDVDVVTFYHLPAGKSQHDVVRAAPEVFPLNGPAKAAFKASFHVDAYAVHLDAAPEILAGRSVYWYGVWSHRRDRLWKGFLQVDLAPTDDADASKALATLNNVGAVHDS